MVFSTRLNLWDMPYYPFTCSLKFFNIVSPFYFHVPGPALVYGEIDRLNMLGLYFYTLIIGHKSCNMLRRWEIPSSYLQDKI